MVVGLKRWQAHFADYADRYVLIGGVACDRLMTEAALDFRLTKDIDVVLLVELVDAAFAEAFWAFIDAGGYQVRSKAEDRCLYRFTDPSAEDFPAMIELYSRAPDGFDLAPGSHLTPLPIDEAVASLSAILLDEAYDAFLRANVVDLAGLPLLGERGLIPFKAKANLDLAARNADGRQIRKHRNDVFRLLQLLSPETRVDLPDAISGDMAAFHAAVSADATFKPADLRLNIGKDEALSRLAAIYQL